MHYSKVRYLYSVLYERNNVPARLVTLHISLENRKPFDLWSITHTISMSCHVLCIPLTTRMQIPAASGADLPEGLCTGT